MALDEWTSDNTAIVPEDPTQIEVAWDIVRTSPPRNGNDNQTRARKQNRGVSSSCPCRSVKN